MSLQATNVSQATLSVMKQPQQKKGNLYYPEKKMMKKHSSKLPKYQCTLSKMRPQSTGINTNPKFFMQKRKKKQAMLRKFLIFKNLMIVSLLFLNVCQVRATEKKIIDGNETKESKFDSKLSQASTNYTLNSKQSFFDESVYYDEYQSKENSNSTKEATKEHSSMNIHYDVFVPPIHITGPIINAMENTWKYSIETVNQHILKIILQYLGLDHLENMSPLLFASKKMNKGVLYEVQDIIKNWNIDNLVDELSKGIQNYNYLLSQEEWSFRELSTGIQNCNNFLSQQELRFQTHTQLSWLCYKYHFFHKFHQLLYNPSLILNHMFPSDKIVLTLTSSDRKWFSTKGVFKNSEATKIFRNSYPIYLCFEALYAKELLEEYPGLNSFFYIFHMNNTLSERIIKLSNGQVFLTVHYNSSNQTFTVTDIMILLKNSWTPLDMKKYPITILNPYYMLTPQYSLLNSANQKNPQMEEKKILTKSKKKQIFSTESPIHNYNPTQKKDLPQTKYMPIQKENKMPGSIAFFVCMFVLYILSLFRF